MNKEIKPILVPDSWRRVDDPELAWRIMVKAETGEQILGQKYHHLSGLELYSFESGWFDLTQRRRASLVTQMGYIARLDGKRYAVMWRPQEPMRPPEVYEIPAYAKQRVRWDERY